MIKNRNYGLDVARVTAILGVIILHIVVAGGTGRFSFRLS